MTNERDAREFDMRTVVALFAISLASACASARPERTAVFSNPQAFDGMVTTACGHMYFAFENHNFYRRESDAKEGTYGVGVAPGKVNDDELRTYHNDRVCITGRVNYSGCGETFFCTGSLFPYEIIVDDLDSF